MKIFILIIILIFTINSGLLSSSVEIIGSANLEKQSSNPNPSPFYGVIGAKFFDKDDWKMSIVFNFATNIDTITSSNRKVFGNALYMVGVANNTMAPFHFDLLIEPDYPKEPFTNFIGGTGFNFNLFYRKTYWNYTETEPVSLEANSFCFSASAWFPIIGDKFETESIKLTFIFGYTFRAFLCDDDERQKYRAIIENAKGFYNGINTGFNVRFGSFFTEFSVPIFDVSNDLDIPGFSSAQVLLNFGFDSSILKSD